MSGNAFGKQPPLLPDAGTTGQAQLTTRASQIVNARRNRAGVKITNLTDVDIYIGYNGTVTPGSGDLLIGIKGAWVFLPVECALWAVGADIASLSYLEVL